MGFALPGAIAIKLAHPEQKVIAVMGDGAFLMNSQELETAVREKIPFVVLVWEDDAYGLIKWKMNLELGQNSYCDFTNPEFMAYFKSLGVKGFRVRESYQYESSKGPFRDSQKPTSTSNSENWIHPGDERSVTDVRNERLSLILEPLLVSEEQEDQDHRSSEHMILDFTAQNPIPVAQLDEIVH
jgi:hypothetical protein